jgi:hypothetical protein
MLLNSESIREQARNARGVDADNAAGRQQA